MKFILSIMALIIPILLIGQTKELEIKELRRYQIAFKKGKGDKYKKYENVVNVKKTDKYTFYEVDSSRIYISYQFYNGGFYTKNDSIAKEIAKEFEDNYGELFSSGFVTSKMFICERHRKCKYPKGSGIYVAGDNDDIVELEPDLFGYKGPTMKIFGIKELLPLRTDSKRRFEIEGTFDKYESGWGGFSVFLLEIENKGSNKEVELKDFLKEAKLKYFKYNHTQI